MAQRFTPLLILSFTHYNISFARLGIMKEAITMLLSSFLNEDYKKILLQKPELVGYLHLSFPLRTK